jgi:IclR family acetate operon transcriptional repressor
MTPKTELAGRTKTSAPTRLGGDSPHPVAHDRKRARSDQGVQHDASEPAGNHNKITPVGVVAKVLRILELLDRSPAGLQLKDIARLASLNKSTAHRFLKHLEIEQYLFRDDSGAYMIGPRLVRFGSGLSYQAMLSRISRPVLEEVWSTTGETVNLATLAGSEILYVDVMESLHTFRLVSQVGSRRPLSCTSLGKAMLAAMPAEQLELLLPTLRFESATPRSITSVARLRKDLAQIVQLGYALDDEEAVSGARCVGAAILDANGKVAGGISISGPTARINKTNLVSIAKTVKLAALEISTRLGLPMRA